MATIDIAITLKPEIDFDPPDCTSGWYVTIWSQWGIQPRIGHRYGPFTAEDVERMRDELMAHETAMIRSNVEFMERQLAEMMQRAQTTQKGV